MFLFPLHVIDVPGDRCHGDDGVLHDLIARVALVKVLQKFLRRDETLECEEMLPGQILPDYFSDQLVKFKVDVTM